MFALQYPESWISLGVVLDGYTQIGDIGLLPDQAEITQQDASGKQGSCSGLPLPSTTANLKAIEGQAGELSKQELCGVQQRKCKILLQRKKQPKALAPTS